ncbi:hypothetical protein BOX15_Mlig008707g2 [Macrostomum lignano]|uniref:Gamma-aminobutyric acid type B receptor subunit 2 n=1 Tax=Macrostomum lignano TaxID=282301 RepID=A0A267GPR2_9PLAT|nr:hypothetical protein BOX15_Mlig008707g2 [Macrostomum lignano]
MRQSSCIVSLTWSLILSTASLCLASNQREKSLDLLHIGALFPMSGDWAGGIACWPAVEMALQSVNDHPDILPDYRLVLHPQDSQCDPGLGARKMYELLYHPSNNSRVVTLLTGCSTVSTYVAQAAHMWNLVVLSYGSSSPALSDRSRFPTFFRTHPSAALNNPTRLKLLQRYNWTRVFVLRSNEEVFASTAKDLEQLLRRNNCSVMTEIVFDAGQAVKQLKSKEARIIIGLFYDPLARQIFCQAYKQGLFGPRYQWLLIGWYSDDWYLKWPAAERVNCTPDEMSMAADLHLTTESMTWNELDQPTYSGITARQFQNRVLERLGKNRSDIGSILGFPESPFAYDAVWALALAMHSAEARLKSRGLRLLNFTHQQPDNPVFFELYRAMNATNFDGVSSRVFFDSLGNRIAWTQIEQLVNGRYRTIGRYQVQEDKLELQREPVWPGGVRPRSEPLIQPLFRPVNAVLYWIMSLLACLGLLACAGCAVFLWRYRRHRVVACSQPVLHAVMLAGCSLSLLAVIVYGVDRFSGGFVNLSSGSFRVLCHAKAWLLSLGFTGGYGSLFAKTWSVYRLATGRRGATQLEPYAFVAVLFLLDAAFLTAWQVNDPLSMKRELFRIERSDDDVEYEPYSNSCESKNGAVWLGVLLGWKGLLLLFGLLLAYETRNVKLKQVWDSRFAGMAVYNTVVLCVITAPVTLIISAQETAIFAFVSIAAWLCCVLSLGLLFLPKVAEVVKSQSSESKSNGGTSSGPDAAGGGTVSKEEEERYTQMLEENDKLRGQISNCEVRLRSLHKQLADWMDNCGASGGGDGGAGGRVRSESGGGGAVGRGAAGHRGGGGLGIEVAEATSGFYSCSDVVASSSRMLHSQQQQQRNCPVASTDLLSTETYL